PGRFARASGNHRMSEIAAAIGGVQIERLPAIVAARRGLAARYHVALAGLPLRWQAQAQGAEANHQTFGIVLEGARIERDPLSERLGALGVQAGALSHAIHRLPQMQRQAEAAARAGRGLETSARIARHGLALPLYPELGAAEQDRVIEALRAALG